MYSTDDKNRFRPHLSEIEETPVSPLGRKILWAIVIFMLIATVWMFLGKTDVVVSARANVVPVGNVKILQALSSGVIKNIYVKEGEAVKKDQLLMEIDPSVEKSNIQAKKKNAQILSLEIAKLQASIEGMEFIPPSNADPSIVAMMSGMQLSERQNIQTQKNEIDAQMMQINDQISALQIDIENARKTLRMGKEQERRMRKVLDIIAKNDYYKLQRENLSYQHEIDRKMQEISTLRSKLNELRYQKEGISSGYKSKLYQMLSQKRSQLAELKAQIDAVAFKEQKQQIKAPMDAVVSKVSFNTLGGVVQPAQELVRLIPKDAPMEFKAIVENKDIGFIKTGMPVAIKIDTYDYQKYGLFEGNVSKISPNAIEDKKLGLVYEVYIKPKNKYLMVDGQKRYLIPGMSATAELKVAQRRIIEFFVYPLIKYYKEGISVR